MAIWHRSAPLFAVAVWAIGCGGNPESSGSAAGNGGTGGNGGAECVPVASTVSGSGNGGLCRCSRGPEQPANFQCPRGTCASATTTLGPSGGKIMLGGTPSTVGVTAEIDVPPGALSQKTTITVTEMGAVPAQFVDWSPVYRFEPVGLVLAVPGKIQLPDSNVSGTVDMSISIHASSSEAGPYAPVPDSYINAGFCQASVVQLGYFFVGVALNESDYPLCQ